MVQMVDSSSLESKNAAVNPTAATTMAFGEPESLKRLAVKLEAEDPEEEESRPPGKRSRYETPYQQWTMGTTAISAQPAIYNPLDEPSPLGLRLRKSPSLLDLIQMRLSQGDAATLGGDGSGNLDPIGKRDLKSSVTSGTSTTDKLKASNFPASLLRIGSWECVSRYEGDLVAKCYFAKHKLVWEVLDGGLKSKIEIQWSDITALKATFPENGPSTLDVVLARQPLFFRETNPQPRKHTLWQATSDFTGGQATVYRRHFLQVPHGLLNKHFEKLIQCDPRLDLLSQREDIPVDSPYFDSRGSAFDDQEESKCHGFDHLKNEYMSPFSGFQDSASTAQTSSSKSEPMDPVSRLHEPVSQETPSPSSVMDSRAIEELGSIENDKSKGSDLWEQFRNPALRSSMSMSDLVNHIEHCITEQMASGSPLPAGEGPWNKDALDEIAQYLLSDSQNQMASDEQCLMTRVNSLYCLLQKDTATDQATHATSENKGNSQGQTDNQSDDDDDDDAISPLGGYGKMAKYVASSNVEFEGGPDRKQSTTMSRKDSLSDLLLNLPRIASLPQFLFNISDDVGDRTSSGEPCE